SKIRNVRDLESINTFGFRGEALPSMASVSIMEMITQQKDEMEGTKVKIEGGVIKDVIRIGSAAGTRISITNLFYNVPARKKFLKSSATELDHIIKYVSWASLAYPNISFKLISNERVLIEARKCNTTLERIYTLYGKEFADNIVELNQEFETIKVHAFIGKPGFTRTNRDYQIFFLNKRPIRSNLLNSAIGSAFINILPKCRYPVVIMCVEIAPTEVDVNVHPAKWEVRFRDERSIYGDVTRCLLSAMQNQEYIPNIDVSVADIPLPDVDKNGLETELPTIVNPRETQIESSVSKFLNRQRSTPPNIVHQYIPREGKRTDRQSYTQDIPDTQDHQIIKQEITDIIRQDKIGDINIKARLFDTYIVAETENEVLFIDQHIADERIIYEKLREHTQKESIPSQGLLLPVTVELSLSQVELLDTVMEMLNNIGFELEPFGGRTIIVRSIPSLIQRGDVKQIVSDIIDQILDSFGKLDKLKLQDEILITTACRSAVQAGDSLTDAEVTSLVRELFKTEQPYLCPHGRPIIVKMNKSELDQKFQRK
ncbi:MAG: DNA mismatch repair endonuclease MutL, partial [Candidatus Poribacteria bacterium]